jgi:hypothetical protein
MLGPMHSFGPTIHHQNVQIDSPSKIPKELLVTPERKKPVKKSNPHAQNRPLQVNLADRYRDVESSDMVQMRNSKSFGTNQGSKTTLQ